MLCTQCLYDNSEFPEEMAVDDIELVFVLRISSLEKQHYILFSMLRFICSC
jgi:hypothetical protein